MYWRKLPRVLLRDELFYQQVIGTQDAVRPKVKEICNCNSSLTNVSCLWTNSSLRRTLGSFQVYIKEIWKNKGAQSYPKLMYVAIVGTLIHSRIS